MYQCTYKRCCLTESFNNSILHQYFDYKIPFVDFPTHTNSRGYFVVKKMVFRRWFQIFRIYTKLYKTQDWYDELIHI